MDEYEMQAFELEKLWREKRRARGRKELKRPLGVGRLRRLSRTYRPPIHKLDPDAYYTLP